jgi:DNA helicase-2/ATP-dependent DNA helicase PcrA
LEQGILTHSDSTYLALQILTKYPHVAAALAKRFSTIIIDEAQDTSEIQHAIFDKLLTGGLVNLELIGDPYQSLYMWRNAKPVVFINKFNDAEWMGLNLSNNWRSTQTIINAYSLLRNLTDEAIVAENTFTNEAAIHIIRFDEGNEADAVDKYKELCEKFESNQVVTRSIELSEKISGLSDADTNYWKNMIGAKITQSVLDFKNNKIKTAIDSLRWVAVNVLAPSLDYKQKK